MLSLNPVYQATDGNPRVYSAQVPTPQGIESKIAQSEPRLTVRDIAGILRVKPQFVRDGIDGLPEHRVDLRRDGSYFVRSYYLSDVVSFLEKARGHPLPDGPLEPLLTTNDVVEILHIDPSTVKKWRNKGLLPAYELCPHTFRYDRGEVEALAGKLTTNEVAEILHVSPYTVYEWGSKGILPRVRLGKRTFRYDPRDVEALAEKLGINIDLKLSQN